MIEAVQIQMIDGVVLRFHNEEAQTIYEQMQNPWLPFLSVKQRKRQTYIHLQNVLYIDFTSTENVEEIKRQIEVKREKIFDSLNLDESLVSAEEIDLYVEGDITYVGLVNGGWQVASEDPQVAKWIFELDELEIKLDQVQAKARGRA